MKHTPGPWIIGKGTYECRNIYAATPAIDDEGFEFHPCIATIEDNDVDCWDGNLRLIAAAPELLAAAMKVNALSIQSDAHKELRAAIANATGDDDAACVIDPSQHRTPGGDALTTREHRQRKFALNNCAGSRNQEAAR